MPAAFRRYVGIDYSGARTPTDSLKGLRVYFAHADSKAPLEVLPPSSPRKYWSRRGVAMWLADLLNEDIPTIVGIDHSFSFPLRYFETHQLEQEWYAFLEDFQAPWPTDEEHVYVDFVRDGLVGSGSARQGNPNWRRLSEERRRAKSGFHFDVQGSVAKSTHSGIPWLLYLHRQLGDKIHFWPFDGWDIASGRSAIVETYPSMWRRALVLPDSRTVDQYDAYFLDHLIAQSTVIDVRDAHLREVGGRGLSIGNSEEQGIRHSAGIIRLAALDVLGQRQCIPYGCRSGLCVCFRAVHRGRCAGEVGGAGQDSDALRIKEALPFVRHHL